jgi:hypothetical protein
MSFKNLLLAAIAASAFVGAVFVAVGPDHSSGTTALTMRVPPALVKR